MPPATETDGRTDRQTEDMKLKSHRHIDTHRQTDRQTETSVHNAIRNTLYTSDRRVFLRLYISFTCKFMHKISLQHPEKFHPQPMFLHANGTHIFYLKYVNAVNKYIVNLGILKYFNGL